MNDKFLLISIIFLCISFTFPVYSKTSGNNLSCNSDSAKVQTEKNLLHLKYALRTGNPYNPIEFIYNGSNEIPAGYMFDDGTPWLYETDINSLRIAGMAGLVLTVETIGYFRLKDLWYDWETTKLHSINFKQDFEKYLWMDKYGHFMHAYFATGLFSRGYRWAGMNGENSLIYGGISGWLWMLQIEIADGFFKEWGFSWGDLIANTVGAGFSVLQQIYPDVLGGIQPKISYRESEALRNHRYINGAENAIDDYEGMTFWLAVNAYHYMPEDIQNKYPEWLKPFGIALGHAAKGIGANPQGGTREIFIGLDYDLRKLSLGNDNSLIRFLKEELNIIRLPLPAVKISPNGVWYGLYF